MNRISKLLITSLLVLVITLCVVYAPVSAATLNSDSTDTLISVEQYEQAMSQLYEQYGIKWEIVDSTKANSITKEIFEAQLIEAKAECEIAKAEQEKSKLSTTLLLVKKPIILSYMPVTANYYKYLRVSYGVLCHVDILATANATYDANYSKFTNINSSSIDYQSGMNFDSWEDSGSSIFINSTGEVIYVHYLGTVHFSYTIPITNIKVNKSIPIDGHYTWTVNDGNQGTYETW